jgi:putative nucleotidyltransferase with HDIG domain
VHADKISIIERIQSNKKLLSLPQVLSEVLREVDKEDFSAESLARIILKDPSLTGRVLRLANSPFYHRLAEAKTIHQALAVLGVTTVKCLALSSSIFDPDKISKKSGIDAKAFFTSVLMVAAATEKIARAIGFKAPEEAFIAGLLHDVGVLFFLHHYPQEYRRVIDKQVKAKTLTAAEVEVFGVDHSEVGARLADVWRLPGYIAASIENHHEYDGVDGKNQLAVIVRLAVLLTGDRFSGYDMDLERRMIYINKLAGLLSLSREQVDDISCSLLSGSVDIAGYLGIDIGDINQMLMKANEEIWKSFLTIEHLFKERQELSRKLLEQERTKGATEAQNAALATLSHYLNNAVMGVYSRSQIMRMQFEKGETDRLMEQMLSNLEVIDRSILKIVAVLQEMKEVSPLDHLTFNDLSKSLNIDDRIERRLQRILRERDNTGTAVNPQEILSS